ncbi:hypothetical protein WR25_01149 [Diploscapter pachys]|uniref:Methionine synthase reductase n=1 Tax=Diploscapter pachys TaxID=2018661 RepID=A0A2A2KBG1_9BILA|nr:hypothetical protein WR25_01149 [Diploscapter pachys]
MIFRGESFKLLVLGLGDSNYSAYQGFPNKLDNILQDFGAERVLERGEADDQVGLELAVEPWIDSVFKFLQSTGELPQSAEAEAEQNSAWKLHFNPIKSKEDKEEFARMEETRKSARQEDSDASDDETVNKKPRLLKASPRLTLQSGDQSESSLSRGDGSLSSDPNLRVPVAPEPFLASGVTHVKLPVDHGLKWQNGAQFPGLAGEPTPVKIVGTALLTEESAKKPKYEFVIDLADHLDAFPYQPGDALYVIVPNREDEVNFILSRTGLLPLADNEFKLFVHPETTRAGAALPSHIPPNASLRYIFTYCLDIRRVPSRPILRALADGAKDGNERRRLMELCSAQGLNEFTQFVRKSGVSLADLLFTFPSVQPSVDRLIELLPRLMPRAYSVASFRGRRVRFVYSVLTFTAEEGRRYERKGLATEYLLSKRVGDTIQVIWKEPSRFRFPPIPSPLAAAEALLTTPLVMIGPGTGIGPFLSFCQFMLKQKLQDPQTFEQTANASKVQRLIFFGCRDRTKDGLYLDELEAYVREGILSELIVCESEAEGKTKQYVQNGIEEMKEKILALVDEKALIFCCGDAKGMSVDLFSTFCKLLEENKGLTKAEAVEHLKELKNQNRYVEDVWS